MTFPAMINVSPFVVAIIAILFVRTKKQVRGIYARFYIALMTDFHSWRNWSSVQFPCNAVS